MRTACQIGIVTHFTSCVAQVQDEALCVVQNNSHHRAACRALLWWAAHLHLAFALLPSPWHDLPQLPLTSFRGRPIPATIHKRWVSAIWLIPPPLHFRTTKKIAPEETTVWTRRSFSMQLLAPESEWAVLEDLLQSEEPIEPEAASADAGEPEAHLQTSGCGGPGYSEEPETHPDAASSNRAASEQRTALSRLQALRIFYGRCPPKWAHVLACITHPGPALSLISNHVTDSKDTREEMWSNPTWCVMPLFL